MDNEDVWFIYIVEYYSAIKKNENCHLQQHGWTWGFYAKWNKSDRERQISYDFTYMWNLKKQDKIETDSWVQRTKLMVAKGRGCTGVKSEEEEWEVQTSVTK